MLDREGYWTRLKSKLRENGGPFSECTIGLRPSQNCLRCTPFINKAFSCDPILKGGENLTVWIYITGPRRQEFFNHLEGQKDKVEQQFRNEKGPHYQLKWESNTEKDSEHCKIAYYGSPVNPEDEADWDRQHEWFVEHLNKLYDAFAEPINELKEMTPAAAVAKPPPTLVGKITESEDSVRNKQEPTNIILYGPPGTGKTYATAREAVILCNGRAPEQREHLMTEYARLSASGRIEFVTFHQSYSYEEFVEGLRPVQGDEGSAGFRLSPEMGAFRRIARRAETSTGPGTSDFTIGNRQVFKMSIGEAANPDDAYLFEEALKGGHTLLGFGDIDWSDARYANREAIIKAYREHGAGEGEPEPTAMSGRVQCPYIFRNGMQENDLVIISKGNSLFRAIGVITGRYEYAPRESRSYSHRRAVRWLWHDRTGVSVEEIYAKGFTQKAIYLLTPADLNVPALERYIASQQPSAGGAPESFVLIIDEINRANISKVFGELITLLEADKRIGADNSLKVRLPYSREMFGVPANLHIIGTMNTADRSIALLDTALRRRFEFRELMPEPEMLVHASAASGVNLVKLLATINERIEYLFDREHQIGHAYFMDCKSQLDVDSVMRYKVIPLLAEYFYEDWTKVAAVLGDAKGEGNFLERVVLKAPTGFEADDGADPRYRWSIKAPFNDTRYEQFQ